MALKRTLKVYFSWNVHSSSGILRYCWGLKLVVVATPAAKGNKLLVN